MAHALEALIPAAAGGLAAGAAVGLAWLRALRASLAPAMPAGAGAGYTPALPGAGAVVRGALARTAGVGLALAAAGLLAGPAAVAGMGVGFALATRVALRRETRGGQHGFGRDAV